MRTILAPAVCLLIAAAAAGAAETAEDAPRKVFFRDVPGSPRPQREDSHNLKIYNGNIAGRTQFPYQAGVYIDFSGFCGGSLINERWVLTAAHCVDGYSTWTVSLGLSNMLEAKQEGRKVFISNYAVRHENYNGQLIINDIGVIQLRRPAVLSEYISLIKLTTSNQNYAGKMATISGFGKVDDGFNAISPVLKYTSMPIVSNFVCAAYYGSNADPSYICLQAEGTSSCEGDSGGPLVVNNEYGEVIQVGLTSFGSSRGCTVGAPVGFTRVGMFLEWISEKTGIAFV